MAMVMAIVIQVAAVLMPLAHPRVVMGLLQLLLLPLPLLQIATTNSSSFRLPMQPQTPLLVLLLLLLVVVVVVVVMLMGKLTLRRWLQLSSETLLREAGQCRRRVFNVSGKSVMTGVRGL